MKSIFTLFCAISIALGANGVHRDGAKGIVIDTRTGLVWQDNAAAASTTATWANAITTCENLVLGGYSDWRLPNINELKSIRDMSRSSPAIDTAFVNTATGLYWSSTSGAAGTTYAWYVNFDYGLVGNRVKGFSNYVRCVRGN